MTLPEQVKLSEVISPWPRQREFIAATRDHEYTLFGGAAGPGKSYILRWWLVSLLIRWFRTLHLTGVRVGLFCEDYPTLSDRHLTKVRAEFPAWLGKLNETYHEFRLWPEYGGGVVAFRNLDRPEKYQSSEFAAIGVDELTQNPRETFDILRARKRWPGIPFNPFAAATNPGGSGHVWVKKLWVDRDFSGDDSRLNPESFAFVPARAGDNPALPSSYLDTLESLPEKLRKAFLLGDWNIFVGQFFDEWSESVHVCQPFTIPPSWPRWCGIDYGNAKPFCCLWLARGPDLTTYVYRELYQTRLTDVAQAQAIRSYDDPVLWRYADPSMWSAQPNGVSIAWTYEANGCPLVQANNDRRAGWLRLREALKLDEDTRKPRLQVFKTCPNLMRTLPGLVHDRVDVEDCDTDGEDHACVAGWTHVDTEDGPTPIQALVGKMGRVYGSDGRLHRFSQAQVTKEHASIYRVTFEDGRTVDATYDHPFRVWSMGVTFWQVAGRLQPRDQVIDKGHCIRYNEVSGGVNACNSHITDDSGILRRALLLLRSVLPAQRAATSPGGVGDRSRSDPRRVSRSPRDPGHLEEQLVGIGIGRQGGSPERPFLTASGKSAQSSDDCRERAASGSGVAQVVGRAAMAQGQRGEVVGGSPAVTSHLRDMWARLRNTVPHPLQVLRGQLPTEGGSHPATIRVRQVRWHGYAPVYNLYVDRSHSFTVEGGIVLHNCDALRYAIAGAAQPPAGIRQARFG